MFKARIGMGAVIMEGQEIAAVARYIEQLERDSRRTTPDREAWQPIETAPKDGTRFMAWHKGRVELFRWQSDDGTNRPVGWRDGFIYVYLEGDDDGPIYWMPLPTAPNGEKR